MKRKIIFFGIEGGHGGSSRSLYYTLCNLSLDKFKITVVCKKNSWIKKKYKKIGIDCKIFKELPCFSSLKGLINNILLTFHFIFIVWPRFYFKRNNYIKLIEQHDIIHLNQISLVFFGLWIKSVFPKKVITMHIRTMPYNNFFSWVKIYFSKKICNKFIFISKQDKAYMCKIIKNNLKGKVIVNPPPDWKLKRKNYNNKISIASLSNYDFERGTDRIIEVASKISKELRDKFVFHMIGDYKIRNRFKYLLSDKNNLKIYAKEMGVKKMFKFYGHKQFPERILNKCQYLIKLTRENNAWGRDIIESMYLGLGIITIGRQNHLIKDNFNGYLFKTYDKEKISKYISSLYKNNNLISYHQKNSKNQSSRIYNKKKLSKRFEDFWLSI